MLLLSLLFFPVFIDLFCGSCTLMFCFMSKSKVFNEILALFNVVMEPAENNTPDCTAGWPRGQDHFVTYAINSRLYSWDVCRSAGRMRSVSAPGWAASLWREVSSGPGSCPHLCLSGADPSRSPQFHCETRLSHLPAAPSGMSGGG